MNGKDVIDNVLPDAVSTDATNIRGTYREIDDLAINIAMQGLINPPTVAWSSSQQKYVVVDGHRRILALRKLMNKEISDDSGKFYEMPENYRLQVITRDFDKIPKNGLRAYRIGANYYSRPPTQMELGTAVIECLDEYCRETYDCLYGEATRKQKTDALDHVADLFRPIPHRKLKNSLRTIQHCGSLKVKAKEKVHLLLETGRISANIVGRIGKFPSEVQEKVVDEVEKSSKEGMTNVQIKIVLNKTLAAIAKDEGAGSILTTITKDKEIDSETVDSDTIIKTLEEMKNKYGDTTILTIHGFPKAWKERIREMAKEKEMTRSELVMSFIKTHL